MRLHVTWEFKFLSDAGQGFFPDTPDIQDFLKIPEDRMHPKYLNFLSKLDMEIYNRTRKEEDGQKSVYAISSYLKVKNLSFMWYGFIISINIDLTSFSIDQVFSRALMINHLFRSMDAIQLIEKNLNLSNENFVICEIEKILKKKTQGSLNIK